MWSLLYSASSFSISAMWWCSWPSQEAEQMWLPDFGLSAPKNYELNESNLLTIQPQYFFFLQYWDLNSGPTPWATPLAHFCEGFFQDKVFPNYLPGLAWNCDPPVSASWGARIIDVSHQHLTQYFFFFIATESRLIQSVYVEKCRWEKFSRCQTKPKETPN
jgi:hypothetical protein